MRWWLVVIAGVLSGAASTVGARTTPAASDAAALVRGSLRARRSADLGTGERGGFGAACAAAGRRDPLCVAPARLRRPGRTR